MNAPPRPRVKKVMLMPINCIFRFLQAKTPITIWLYEDNQTRFEGVIIGFDEYMNLTLDDVFEVSLKTGKREGLGRLLLKGDSVTLIQERKAAA